MSRRTLTRLLVRCIPALVLSLAGCQRYGDGPPPVRRMAYAVKPAVVRVSAVATADFVYPLSEMAKIARLVPSGETAAPGFDPSSTERVSTGAGGSGSGFIIDPSGLIMTSGHLVSKTRDERTLEAELARNGAVDALLRHFPVELLRSLYRKGELDGLIGRLARAGSLSGVTARNEVELSNGERYPFEVIDYSPALSRKGRDVAILRIKRGELPVLPLGNSDQVRIGDPVWAVGYPAVASTTDEVIGGWLSQDSDLEATFNNGVITSIKKNAANFPVFQTNAAIYHGNSGGPVVDDAGVVIGISTWGHTSAEQIKFLVPINVARQMLAAKKIALSGDGEFNRVYRRALERAGSGNWLAAREDLLRAAILFPNSPDLIRFQADAERAIRELPYWKTHPVPIAIIAAAATMMIAALIRIRRARFAGGAYAGEPLIIEPAPRESGSPTEYFAPSGTLHAGMLGRLTILNGGQAGMKLGLGGSGIRIGRESAVCEIVLENPKVSRLHAEIVSLDGKVLLIDRNSSNGTYVNDRKIDRQVLRDGDIIYFGGRNAVAVAYHT